MAALDTRPKVQDINAYGGDTLTIKITAPDSITAGKTWNAHLKTVRESEITDAEFEITPPEVPGGPAYLVLSSAVTTALVEGMPLGTVRNPDGTTKAAKKYQGVYDCQISLAGLDPVRTLVQGTITLDQDVTRLP